MNKKMKIIIMSAVMLMVVMGLARTASAQPILLGTANTVTLRGEINDDSAQKTALEIMHLSNQRGAKDYTIYLVLDTPGGSIDAGESLIEVIKTVPNLKTITIFAASMGSAIVQALPGERLMLSSGIQMFHRASGGVRGQFEDGEMEVRLAFFKKLVRQMELRSAKRMSMSLKSYKAKVKDELWYLADESVENKAADRIVSVQCTEVLTAQKNVTSIEVFIFKIDLEYSGCPLLRNGIPAAGQAQDSIDAYNKYRSLNYNLNFEKGV